MKRQSGIYYCFFLVFSVALIIGAPASSQTSWLQISDNNRLGIEASKANLADDRIDQDFLSSVWFISGNFEIARDIDLVFDVPFVNFQSHGISEALLGNPYIGIEHGRANGPVIFLGARIPIASEEHYPASAFGATTYYDRFEAFWPHTVPISFNSGYRFTWNTGVSLLLTAGGTYWQPTEDRYDSEFFINYRGEIKYNSEKGGFAAGIIGRALLTESDLNFGERTTFLFGVAGERTLNKVRLGMHIFLPMEDTLSRYVDFIYGVNLAIDFGAKKKGNHDAEESY